MAGVSPAKTAELRIKNLEQLRYLKELFDNGIIIFENKLVEQKKLASAGSFKKAYLMYCKMLNNNVQYMINRCISYL